MLKTRISAKGQIVIPKAIRDRHNWKPGTELVVEERRGTVVLQSTPAKPHTRLDDVAGCLKYDGPPISIEEMKEGIVREVKRRHARGRY